VNAVSVNRVAVTGLGVLSSLGQEVDAFWKALRSGQSGFLPLPDPGEPKFRFSLGATVSMFDPKEHFETKEIAYLDRFSQFATVAARQAVEQSGLCFSGDLKDRSAVITGSGVGGQGGQEDGYLNIYRRNVARVSPLTIPRTMANSAASQISLEHGIHGPSYTVSTACSSATHAIGQAFRMVRNGEVIAAVTGGSEAVFYEGLLRAWEALRLVSPDICKPFSRDRRGLLLGEGGAMLVLENWNHALERGAPILGEVCGFGMSSDAHHVTQPSVVGPSKAMLWALNDAGVSPQAIQYINAHGTGTKVNDAIEMAAIRKVFDQHANRLLISSTKSMHGHALGAAGAIEAVATLLALRYGIVPPTCNYTECDPDCDLDVVPNIARTASIEYAMSNSFAFGGLNAVLVFRRSGE
jgi:nodulation protein E